jgi:maltose alpha-D-glucosyltransferase/alpha-amylase
VLQYGDEIGMGDDLSRRERLSVRTPMQWTADENAGFSTAPTGQLVAEAVKDGPFGYEKVNVYDQQRRPGSLLTRISEMVRTRIGLTEIGFGEHRVLDTGCPSVVALLHEDERDGTVVTLVNLAADDVEVRIPGEEGLNDLVDVLTDGEYPPEKDDPPVLRLAGHGYRWLRPRSHVFR